MAAFCFHSGPILSVTRIPATGEVFIYCPEARVSARRELQKTERKRALVKLLPDLCIGIDRRAWEIILQ